MKVESINPTRNVTEQPPKDTKKRPKKRPQEVEKKKGTRVDIKV